MRGVYIVIFFFILSFSQSYAQVETQYYQEGDTISFFQNVLFQRQNGITIKMPAFDLEHAQGDRNVPLIFIPLVQLYLLPC